MKRAYMTIDDGPSTGRKAKVDILNKYGIQAIWFSMGIDIEKRREEAIYTIQNGQIIGNHSYTHPNFSSISLEQCYEEIRRTDEMIDELYKEVNVVRPMKVFRFPYGNKGVEKGFYEFDYTPEEAERIQRIQEMLRELGYTPYGYEGITYQYFARMQKLEHIDWLWTYDAMEWCMFQEKPLYGVKCLDDVLEMMELDLPERWMGLNYPKSNEIIVIHDHPQTTDSFESIIKGLVEKNIEFIKYC